MAISSSPATESSPAAKAKNADLASYTERLGALAVDTFAAGLGSICLFYLVNLVMPQPADNFLPMVTLLAWTYLITADAFPRGQSLGKRILGISVVDAFSNQFCSPGQALLRNCSRVLNFWDVVWAFGSRRRRLGDLLAGTEVIRLEPWRRGPM